MAHCHNNGQRDEQGSKMANNQTNADNGVADFLVGWF